MLITKDRLMVGQGVECIDRQTHGQSNTKLYTSKPFSSKEGIEFSSTCLGLEDLSNKLALSTK